MKVIGKPYTVCRESRLLMYWVAVVVPDEIERERVNFE
jgi:hypothetical protein